jgi:putative PEP-CTERM system histidine kinase
MDSSLLKSLSILNLLALGTVLLYLTAKAITHRAAALMLIALLPLATFELGSHLFVRTDQSARGTLLILFSIALSPLAFTPLSHGLGRHLAAKLNWPWVGYYSAQLLILGVVFDGLVTGRVIEWVTGTLDGTIILIDKDRRLLFVNVLVGCGVSLLCFENTLKNATGWQQECLKHVTIAFIGFVVYFSYIGWHIFTHSYITQPMLLAGSAIITVGTLLIVYSLAKYPLWRIQVNISRRLVFGCLSFTALSVYLLICGNLLALVQSAQPDAYSFLLPVATFTLCAILLLIYLSPHIRKRIEILISRNFFRNKYDYRELWMRFSEKASGSLNLNDLMPKLAEFVADTMFVGQVAIWLRFPNTASFSPVYCHDSTLSNTSRSALLELNPSWTSVHAADVYHIQATNVCNRATTCPLENTDPALKLGITRIVPVIQGDRVQGFLGIGPELGGGAPSKEDDQLLASISSQLAHLIMAQQLSEELLLFRHWESFNRWSSFIVHDLKNLASLQSMIIENARTHGDNPSFLVDAFATFGQTTGKMIDLIASLSVQGRAFSFNQKPINILQLVSEIFDELSVRQTNGVKVIKRFPPEDRPSIIFGDPELLKNVFRNVLLNAIQSLPNGVGSVEVSVSRPTNGKVTTSIKDTGCGIPPEQLQNLFRPFQTTKKQGMGIGLCHTQSILEIHGGQIRIESQVNAGTRVDIELPILGDMKKGAERCESKNPAGR